MKYLSTLIIVIGFVIIVLIGCGIPAYQESNTKKNEIFHSSEYFVFSHYYKDTMVLDSQAFFALMQTQGYMRTFEDGYFIDSFLPRMEKQRAPDTFKCSESGIYYLLNHNWILQFDFTKLDTGIRVPYYKSKKSQAYTIGKDSIMINCRMDYRFLWSSVEPNKQYFVYDYRNYCSSDDNYLVYVNPKTGIEKYCRYGIEEACLQRVIVVLR